jgi:hypothetical protein
LPLTRAPAAGGGPHDPSQPGGFLEDVKEVVARAPAQRQTSLVSVTSPGAAGHGRYFQNAMQFMYWL